jgi:hypothetical protein
MSLLCGFINNLWNKIYDSCFRELSKSSRISVGGIFIVASLILFVFSTKGSKKGEMVGSWFLFWISAIAMVLGFVYVLS